ncbi:hypothetical protein GGF42_002082 [Coemansia sp. RSA 2424]|nr:hypothetical protein GGF42_002082 [Coemansia sp. RSA 2424]
MDRRFPPFALPHFLAAACSSHNVKFKADLETVNRQNQLVFTAIRNLAIIRALRYENDEKDILRRFLEKEQKLHVALIVQEQEKLIKQLIRRIVKELGLAETLAPLATQALTDVNAENEFHVLAQAAFDAKARLTENKRLVEALQRNNYTNDHGSNNYYRGNGRSHGRHCGNSNY